jgi:hypothetical protein
MPDQRTSATPHGAPAGDPHGGSGGPPDTRAALAARLDECWARLEDVVSELAALHEVNEDSIVERTRGTIAAEHDPDAPA